MSFKNNRAIEWVQERVSKLKILHRFKQSENIGNFKMSNLLFQIPYIVNSAMEYGSDLENYNHPSYQMILNDFGAFLKTNVKRPVTCYTMGSRVMGLAMENSDLDIFLSYGESVICNF